MPTWLDTSSGGAWAMLLFALFLGHFVADFPLQSEFMAKFKNRHVPPVGRDADVPTLWLYCLVAHASVHAATVWVLTGCVWLGLTELVLHCAIDYSKTERWIGFHTDQAFHLLCKVGYVAVLFCC